MDFAKRYHHSNQVLRIELARASRNFEANPFNEFAQDFVATLYHEIRKANLYEGKGAQLWANLNWLKVGDKVSKEFFKCLHPPIHRSQF